MKILFVDYFSTIGGGQKSLLELLTVLKERDFSLGLVLSSDGPIVPEVKKRGVPYTFVNMGKGKLRYAHKSIPAFFRMYNIIKKFDLVHANCFNAAKFAFLPACILKKPLIFHKRIFVRKGSQLGLEHRIFAKFFTKIIAVSDAVRNSLIATGVEEKKITVVKNAIKLRKFKNYTNRKAVGTAGIFRMEKGFEYFIEAAKEISRYFPQSKFHIVGDAYPSDIEYKSKLFSLREKLGLDKSLFFTGMVKDLFSILPKFSVFVLPSIREPFGRVILEAMACSLPVVATDDGGVPEIIEDGKEGILIPPKDPDAIARAVISILKNKSLAREMGNRGRKKVEKYFSMERYIDELEKVYKSVI